MTVESLSERQIFASEENEYLVPSAPPLSRMAVASAILGVISAAVLLNFDLMVIPILAVSVGAAAYWLIARSDALSGRSLALAGIGLGLTFGVWSFTNVQLRDRYLHQVAAQFAQHYLNTIAQGRLLEAHELMQPESARQVAGTSLDAYYSSLDEMSRSSIDSFKSDSVTKRVQQRGPDAQWQLQQGVAVGRQVDGGRRITVRMVDSSTPSAGVVDVVLAREFPAALPSWRVVNMK